MTIAASVSAPNVARVAVAGYRDRVMAALVDGLVLYSMALLIRWSWLVIAQPRGAVQNEPPLVSALNVVLIGLYILATTAIGRTLGMRTIGLRIVRSDDGGPLGLLRVLSRSLVLLLATGLLLWVHPALAVPYSLLWVHPALAVPYSLWMLFNTKHQMLHDQIAGTVVIRTTPSVMTPRPAGAALPPLGQLDPPQARALFDELDQVRRRARGDLHAASVPLFVLGLLAVGGALADLSEPMLVSLLYWTLAGPVGLVGTALWFRRLQRRQGAGAGAGPLVTITILVSCAEVVAGFLPLGGVITAVGFLALALTQRNRVLAVAALIFGLVAGAEQPLHFISNGIFNHVPNASAVGILEYHGSAMVFIVLGLLLLGTGVSAFRRERTG